MKKLLVGAVMVMAAGAVFGQGSPVAGAAQVGRRERPEGKWSFEAKPVVKDDVEAKALGVLEEMAPEGRRMQSVPMDDGRFLRILAESTGATNAVEIGTSQGYSAIWLGLAMKRTGGRLTTYEIDAERAGLAQKNFEKAGVADVITLVLGDAHEKVEAQGGPIDILFLDADKDGYIDYLKKLLPKVRAGGLVVAHNINPHQADPRYIEAITKDKDLETLLVNLQASGISVSMKKR